MEERHQTFLNRVLKRELRETLQLVCKRENGEGLQPEKLAENCMGMINKTVALILEGNHPRKTFPPMLR